MILDIAAGVLIALMISGGFWYSVATVQTALDPSLGWFGILLSTGAAAWLLLVHTHTIVL